MDQRTWLRHPATGGTFHCPDGATEAWVARGWEPGEPPEEPDTTKDPEPAALAAPVEVDLEPTTEDAEAAPEHEES